jgi:hypothetical protein
MVTYYVIRNKETGLYIKGTPRYHQWFKEPRLFTTIGRLRGFISLIIKMREFRNVDMSQWIVDEMVMTATNSKEIHEIITGKKMMELLST